MRVSLFGYILMQLVAEFNMNYKGEFNLVGGKKLLGAGSLLMKYVVY
jgi:hypothetical protein